MKIRAMVFVDNLFLRSKINQFLALRGYQIVTFSNPADCPLLRSDTCHYACADILISDLSMPNTTALQVVGNHLRKGCRIRNVALTSGTWSPEELAQAKKIGCRLFRKPLQFNELSRWLDECESRVNPKRLLSDELLQMKVERPAVFL